MTKGEIFKFLVLRSIGNFLLLFAIFGVFATFGPALYYEAQYRVIQVRGVKFQVFESEQEAKQAKPSLFGEMLKKQEKGNEKGPISSGFASILTGPQEQILIPKDTEFSILIPKIGATAKIFSNINPSDESEFQPVLLQGVAHAKGTVFPGMKGNVYLFAHSTDNFWDAGRYNAVFYLLKDLSAGDEIIIFFENKRHNYIVTDSRIAEESDVSYLVNGQDRGEETLILQSCWPPGTTWKRLLVFAKPK